MPSDIAIVRYREFIKQWDDKGWRIDIEQVKKDELTKVYAIPSPRRRLEKGWVFDEVPLIPGSQEEPIKKVVG